MAQKKVTDIKEVDKTKAEGEEVQSGQVKKAILLGLGLSIQTYYKIYILDYYKPQSEVLSLNP